MKNKNLQNIRHYVGAAAIIATLLALSTLVMAQAAPAPPTPDIGSMLQQALNWLLQWIYSVMGWQHSGGKLLILTSASMDGADLQQYTSWRSGEFSVKVVHAEGADPASIKQLIISENPGYVLIAGDATKVPAAGASDLYYSDLDSDGIMDIPLGRLSVKNTQELHNILYKIKAFETQQQYLPRSILLGAGSEAVPPASGWKTATYWETEVRPALAGWAVTPFYCDNNPAGYSNPYLSSFSYPLGWINSNQFSMIAFQGHSTGTGFMYMGCSNRQLLIQSYDVAYMTNTRYPIFVAFSCTTATTQSADNWLSSSSMASQHGFSAFIGAVVSGGLFPKKLWQYMGTDKRLGDAFFHAVTAGAPECPECDQNYFKTTLSRDFMLMGDPTMRIG